VERVPETEPGTEPARDPDPDARELVALEEGLAALESELAGADAAPVESEA
jgi:hypothetical protein